MYKSLIRLAAVAGVSLLVAACGSTKINMTEMQTTTAKSLGLASSDELTVANVQYKEKNALGGQELSYDATTARGRKFACTAYVTPGLTPFDKATYSEAQCSPKKK
ncbi:hypothetical protein [Schauerella aestuarii]|uniref:hypothetical protein n=1 Tax=Schauerella aestuarii TaxID=2511204 RepID=UPI001F3A5B1D|nr:hypothetical protein [Achromobacter aestuarii]